MPIQVREIVIKAVVGKPEAPGVKQTGSKEIKQSNKAQMTVSMVEEMIKMKKER